MEKSIHILILEDNPVDAELIQFELQEAGFVITPKVVTTKEDFEHELQDFSPDLILSDYDLPQYNGALALAEAKTRCPDTPFILVTGAVSEDRAIEILTQGAKDYVLKARLQQRLAPAVRRALAEAEEHRARRQAEEELRQTHRTLEERVQVRTVELEAEMAARKKLEAELWQITERLDMAQRAAKVGTWDWDVAGGHIEWSAQMFDLFGLDPLKHNASFEVWKSIIHPEDIEIAGMRIDQALSQRTILQSDYRIVLPDGRNRWINAVGEGKYDKQGRPTRMTGICMDITDRKKAEEALREREATLRGILDAAQESIWLFHADGRVLLANTTALQRFGKSADEVIGFHIRDGLSPALASTRLAYIQQVIDTGRPLEFEDDRAGIRFHHSFYPVFDTRERVTAIACFSRDITEHQQAQGALRQSEEKYRLLFKNMTDGFALYDLLYDKQGKPADWRILEVNDAYRSHTGVAPERLVGRSISEVFPDTISEYLPRFAAVVATQTASDFETYVDVTGRYLHVTTFPAGGHRFANIIEDITERKKIEEALRESNERFRAITIHTPDHILMQNYDLRYQLVINPQRGLTEKDMLGKTDHDILAKAEAEEITAIKRKVLETGTSVTVESSVVNAKGEMEFFEGIYIPKFGPTGQTDGLIGYFRNITRRKIVEDQLAKQTEQLQEHSIQMENANRELESFSYSVSHDLKAPLRTIDGYSRMLIKKHGDQLSEDAARILNVIRSSTERMGALIDDLLSFSRVLRDSMSISEIDMDQLVSEIWDEIREANRDRELELKITKLLPGFGDRPLIRQVLINLFSNAVKFTKNQKPGIIEMTSYRESDKIIYCLKDNGVGFDMAYYDKLFGVFQRLHSLEEYEGTGVGLAIVQRIVARHGGQIWAEGKADEGATFFFSLPEK